VIVSVNVTVKSTSTNTLTRTRIDVRRLSATTDCVKTLEMCFDSAQHERLRD
jgi:hypothetical protein